MSGYRGNKATWRSGGGHTSHIHHHGVTGPRSRGRVRHIQTQEERDRQLAADRYASRVREVCAAIKGELTTAEMVVACYPKTDLAFEEDRAKLHKLLTAPGFLAALDLYWTKSTEPETLWNGKTGYRRRWHAPHTVCPHCNGSGHLAASTTGDDIQW